MIVSYETLRTLTAYIANCEIGLLLCDEGHRLKNSGTFKITSKCQLVDTMSRVADFPDSIRLKGLASCYLDWHSRSGSWSSISNCDRCLTRHLQNDLSEYFSLLNFANPNFLGSKNDFRKNFENAIIRGRDSLASDEIKAQCEKKLKELGGLVTKFIIRRTNDLLSKYCKVIHLLLKMFR